VVDGERQVSEPNRNIQSKVIVNIQPGPISLAQKQAWKRFWQSMIAEAPIHDSSQSKNEAKEGLGK
jgi:hypothetical protein